MLFFLIGTFLSSVMEGGGGIVATRLSQDHTADVTTLTVSGTEGFLKADYVQIGNEKIRYTNKTNATFTDCTRGYADTEAVSHDAGAKVYSPDSEVLNSALGFNLISTGAEAGTWDAIMIAKNFFTVTMPRMILWDYSWLKDGWLQYLRLMFQAMSVGFLIYMAVMIISAVGTFIGRFL